MANSSAQNGTLNSGTPQGPVGEKWESYKGHVSLVAPNNKRRIDVIVVGSGLKSIMHGPRVKKWETFVWKRPSEVYGSGNYTLYDCIDPNDVL